MERNSAGMRTLRNSFLPRIFPISGRWFLFSLTAVLSATTLVTVSASASAAPAQAESKVDGVENSAKEAGQNDRSAPGAIPEGANSAPPLEDEAAAQTRQILQLISEAQESLGSSRWVQAAEQFDAAWELATRKEDPLIISSTGDQDQLAPGRNEVVPGVRSRLILMFRSANADFRKEYERQFGALAEQKVNLALRNADQPSLKSLALRYRFLPAAQTAARVLARTALDRGDSLNAVLMLGMLRSMTEKPSAELAVQSAIAAWTGGLTDDAVETIKEIVAENPGGSVRLAGKEIVLPKGSDEISAWLVTVSGRSPETTQADWAQPLGNFRRSAKQGIPVASLRSVWCDDLFNVTENGESLNPMLSEAGKLLRMVNGRSDAEFRSIIPVFNPLLLKDRLIYRTAAGCLRAVNAGTGELLWESLNPDTMLESTAESARRPRFDDLEDNSGSTPPDQTPGAVPDAKKEVNPALAELVGKELYFQLSRTNPAGQISSDGTTLYVCEESSSVTWNSSRDFRQGQENERIPANYLRAYSSVSGKLIWEAGGQRLTDRRSNQLSGFYFLGAPLVLGQRIYVLAESGEGIFLLQLSPPVKSRGRSAVRDSLNPSIVHSQLLSNPQYKLNGHPVRKHAGLIPSYASGLLICPTCDDHVIAVSAADHSVRWVYRYAGNVRIPDLGMDEPVLAGAMNAEHSLRVDLYNSWTDSLPRIINQRIIVTPRDSDEIFCLDLQTGRQVWSAARGFFRTIAAVTDELVILTGHKSLTGLKVEDGSVAWSSELPDGQIAGVSGNSGGILVVPSTSGAIHYYEMSSGKYLFSGQLPASTRAGNVLMMHGRIYLQEMTSICALAPASDAEPMTAADRAGSLLLNRKEEDAIALLSEDIRSNPSSVASREMLTDILMQSLKSDFETNSRHIPQIRELISNVAIDTDQISELLEAGLGMNLSDAAEIPSQLEQLDRSGRRMNELMELILQGLQDSKDLPVDKLAASLAELLPEVSPKDDQIVRSGTLTRQKSQTVIAGIRRILGSRTPDDKQKIESILAQSADQMIEAAQGDSEQLLRLIRNLRNAGMSEAAGKLAMTMSQRQDLSPESMAAVRLQTELILLSSLRSGAGGAESRIVHLLNQWKNAGDSSAIRNFVHDISTVDGNSEFATQKFSVPGLPDPGTITEQWLKENPDLQLSRSDVWNTTPVLQPSADSTMLSPDKNAPRGPMRTIPQFGTIGLYRGWTFCQEFEHTAVAAYDRDGFRRWSFQPPVTLDPTSSAGRVTERYLMSFGHLIAMKLGDRLFVLDGTTATPETPPTLLWKADLRAENDDPETAGIRQFTPGWERIPSYAPEPAGLFPCGPLSSSALPIIRGRQLRVLDPVTGTVLWQINGIASDAVLLGTSETLMILSESAGQIETRSLLDGEIVSVSGLPEWWVEANENVGASVRDIELEAGLDLLWRIAAEGDSCLLFRLSAEKATLERRSILNDTVLWQIHLPVNTVFSNVAEDMVATLSDGKDLRVFRTDTGTELASHTVTAVPVPRELYLRATLDRLIVLPEAVDDPSLDLDPVADGLHVFGRMYGLDRDSLQLVWDHPLEHRFIRIPGTVNGTTIPNAPILVLLARQRMKRPAGTSISVRYLAQVFDVKTGQEIHRSENVGVSLYPHTIRIDALKRELTLRFENFLMTMKYGTDEASDSSPTENPTGNIPEKNPDSETSNSSK